MKYTTLLFILLFSFLSTAFSQNPIPKYKCLSCNKECDKLTFDVSGICNHCQMNLIESDNLLTTEIDIQTGSGVFFIDGKKENVIISVYYYKPKKFDSNSKILLVIPGAGRNADTYRDSWIDDSEEFNLLILSPMYNEEAYGFEDYHLCGLVNKSNLKSNIEYIENTNIVMLEEDGLNLSFNTNSDSWLFNDFDRIFGLTTEALATNQKSYDIFGHSAGGHILHRLALFNKHSKVNKIIASNASFYTLPGVDYNFPFGLKDMPINAEFLKYAFKKNLIVFLGELDNENEARGTFLRSESADKQGIHRLERGKFFFNDAKEIAEKYNYEYNWKIIIVSEIGHDYKLMGDKAAEYLYGNSKL